MAGSHPLSVGGQLRTLGHVPIRAPSKEELVAPLQRGNLAAGLQLLILSGLSQFLSQGHVLEVAPANDGGKVVVEGSGMGLLVLSLGPGALGGVSTAFIRPQSHSVGPPPTPSPSSYLPSWSLPLKGLSAFLTLSVPASLKTQVTQHPPLAFPEHPAELPSRRPPAREARLPRRAHAHDTPCPLISSSRFLKIN